MFKWFSTIFSLGAPEHRGYRCWLGKFQNVSCISCSLKHNKISAAKFTMVDGVFLLQNVLTGVFACSRVSSFVQIVNLQICLVEILNPKKSKLLFTGKKRYSGA